MHDVLKYAQGKLDECSSAQALREELQDCPREFKDTPSLIGILQ